jgi:aspartyl-tRNA(Asn)/glutamyl-tRNA(Gln) amidotransferase subunit A
VDGACWSIDTIGPISRTVADCAATIGAIAGYDQRDPYTRQVPVPNYQEALSGDVQGVRIGLVQELMDPAVSGVDPQTAEAVQAAASLLEEMGAELKQVSMPISVHTGPIIRTITHTERVSLHPEWLRERPQDYHPNTRVAFTAGNLIPAQVYYKAVKLRAVVRQHVLELLQDVDVLLQPTSSGPAAKMGSGEVTSKAQAKQALAEGSFRGPYSLSGAPALSILCGFTSPGEGALPLAMQIAGRPFDESTVLRVAHAYEQNTPWHNRRPPV